MGATVTLCIPAAGPPTWALLESLLRLHLPDGGCEFRRVGGDDGMAIDIARNRLVHEFLIENQAEWLWFVDRDAKLHPDTLLRLLSWNQPVVGALAFTRHWPVAPIVYAGEHHKDEQGRAWYKIQVAETREWLRTHPDLWTSEPVVLEPRPDDALRQVDFTGAHCLLIQRRVLEAIEYPWFQLDPDTVLQNHRQVAGTGCDRFFCERVRAAGFPIYVDRSVVAGHQYGERSLGALDFLAWDKITDWKE